MLLSTSLSPVQSESALQLPEYQGYISVAPSKRYFQDENGKGFLVIGQNDAISWPGLVELLNQSAPQTTTDYIKDLRRHGITVSRVMIEYAQEKDTYFEQQIGSFSPTIVRFWDQFIAQAAEHGLYLLLTPYDTFWQVKHWHNFPYNAAAGGPVEKLHDWLTSPACINAHKARWDFMLQRWGGSPNIFAWDLMNEIDLYWGCTPQEINDYITEMASFIREREFALWGKRHLLTVSSATPTPDTELGQVIYNHPLLDFANTHLYVGQGTCSPNDAIECVEEMISGVRLSLQSISSPRPYLDTESGPIYDWINDPAVDREYHHNMSWAHLMAGGAGSGMRWPYTEPHWLLPEFRENLLGLARFAASVDWAHFASRNITNHLRVNRAGIIKTGCSDYATCCLIWLMADTRAPYNVSLSGVEVSLVHTLPDGDYCVELWETYSGTLIYDLHSSVTEKKFKLVLPTLNVALQDVALVIRKAS